MKFNDFVSSGLQGEPNSIRCYRFIKLCLCCVYKSLLSRILDFVSPNKTNRFRDQSSNIAVIAVLTPAIIFLVNSKNFYLFPYNISGKKGTEP